MNAEPAGQSQEGMTSSTSDNGNWPKPPSHAPGIRLRDPNVKAMDSQENNLFGIQNNSGSYMSLTGYDGSNNVFSDLHLMGELGNGKHAYFEMKDLFEHGNGKDNADDDDHCKVGVTPEPSSIALLGTGLMALGGILRRRLRS
jgi:PEP-CTERM motif-containing protein